MEARVPGNREHREQLGLPWLSYSSDRFDLGQAITEAEQETGLDVKVGLWKDRRLPHGCVLVGKFSGDHDEADLPLYVVAGPAGKAEAANPQERGRRLSKDERLLFKVATRLIHLERQVAFFKWTTLLSFIITLSAIAAVVILIFRLALLPS
jgi:hypothetical protein